MLAQGSGNIYMDNPRFRAIIGKFLLYEVKRPLYQRSKHFDNLYANIWNLLFKDDLTFAALDTIVADRLRQVLTGERGITDKDKEYFELFGIRWW